MSRDLCADKDKLALMQMLVHKNKGNRTGERDKHGISMITPQKDLSQIRPDRGETNTCRNMSDS